MGKMSKMLNSKGQAFTIFRLIIGATIALMVLIIIISAISYVETFKFQISQQRLFEQFNSALNSPNGKIVEVKDLTFKAQSVFSAASLAKNYNLKTECIELDAKQSTAMELNPSNKTITFTAPATITAYSQCSRTDETDCPIKCNISFGKQIQ